MGDLEGFMGWWLCQWVKGCDGYNLERLCTDSKRECNELFVFSFMQDKGGLCRKGIESKWSGRDFRIIESDDRANLFRYHYFALIC